MGVGDPKNGGGVSPKEWVCETLKNGCGRP